MRPLKNWYNGDVQPNAASECAAAGDPIGVEAHVASGRVSQAIPRGAGSAVEPGYFQAQARQLTSSATEMCGLGQI